ncbi:aminoglycoside 6'-N-acetyltransferase [Exiguobacterium flavidum]|uniref:aminoglycoside 6'-N-acetyltransferase n=1 Tax=Exiguobacterium flavidum TaxID=2184695 RepID=UPI000DF7AAC4|nr:aminoglycoside 6'-N-acetyltransferase [Exiguobacterium flavidum]
MQFYRAMQHDAADIASLALQLWPHASYDELLDELDFDDPMQSYILARVDLEAIGFCHVALRFDYVEGTSSSPVAYLEGIFVVPQWRNQKVAAGLIEQATRFGREQGCTELASDTELSNTESQAFHEALGFKEANRIVCYTKRI